jgi:hypothetical protein
MKDAKKRRDAQVEARAANIADAPAARVTEPQLEMFYNRADRCVKMRAFSGLRWKTHVFDGASKIAEIRNCSESG